MSHGRRLITALVLVLLAATAVAFGVAERLKLERSPVTAPRFDRLLSPTCDCAKGVAELSVRLRRADRVDASIVDMDGDQVHSLVTDLERRRGRATFEWDGRDDAGEPARDGRYRLRVHLDRADRTITIPTPIRVDGTPPSVELLETRPRALSPDGDGRGDRILFTYRANEISYAVIVVRGIDAVRGRYFAPGPGRVSWRGRLNGRVPPVGSYEAAVVVVDRAGNRSELTRSVTIPLRFIELVGVPRRVAPGGRLRFTIDADAAEVLVHLTYHVGKGFVFPARRVAPGRVRLRAPRNIGRYDIVASASGHADRAFFRVVRR